MDSKAYGNTGRVGMTPQTRTIISTKNRIYAVAAGKNANMMQIGVVSGFSPTESRDVQPIRGIGYGDMIAELVPGNTDAMTISLQRTALYLANVMQVLGYNAGVDGLVRSLRHHKFPFDIKQEIIFSDVAKADQAPPPDTTKLGTAAPKEFTPVTALITYFEGCWMTNYSVDYQADTAIIQESVDIIVTDVTDGSSTYSDSVDTGLSGQNGSGYSKVWKTS